MSGRADDAAIFYAARDRRTVEYGADEQALTRPIALHIDVETAATRAGQVALIALVEMLFRVHRNIRLAVPDTPTIQDDESLATRALRTARAIDPFQHPLRAPDADEIVIYVSGKNEITELDADVLATWRGGRGEVHLRGTAPVACDAEASTSGACDLLGAATAACLAAAAVFALVHDQNPSPAALNLLTRASGGAACEMSKAGPIDVGDVDIVGAGAVGHALTYWANEFGVIGTWTVIDGDRCEIHNTNRCLAMTVADAGWPDGLHTGTAEMKSATAARIIDAISENSWYDQLPLARSRADLTLVLANEREVRSAIAARGEPLLLQATTSPNWTAELHRHIPGRDDCPHCRIPSTNQATFTCAEGPSIATDQTSGDAALPFLSAMAGLLLAIALLDLDAENSLLAGRENHWRVHMELPKGEMVQSMIHRGASCPHHLVAAARRLIQEADGRRWDGLDD